WKHRSEIPRRYPSVRIPEGRNRKHPATSPETLPRRRASAGWSSRKALRWPSVMLRYNVTGVLSDSTARWLSGCKAERFRWPRHGDVAATLPFRVDLCQSRLRFAANAAGRFFSLDLGKKPHRENHETSKEGDDVLDAVVPQRMLVIKRDRGDQHDQQRKSEFDFDRHRTILRNDFRKPRSVRQLSPTWRAPTPGCRPG